MVSIEIEKYEKSPRIVPNMDREYIPRTHKIGKTDEQPLRYQFEKLFADSESGADQIKIAQRALRLLSTALNERLLLSPTFLSGLPDREERLVEIAECLKTAESVTIADYHQIDFASRLDPEIDLGKNKEIKKDWQAGYLSKVKGLWVSLGEAGQESFLQDCENTNEHYLGVLRTFVPRYIEEFKEQFNRYLTELNLEDLIPVCIERIDKVNFALSPISLTALDPGRYTAGRHEVAIRSFDHRLPDEAITDETSPFIEHVRKLITHELLHAASVSYNIRGVTAETRNVAHLVDGSLARRLRAQRVGFRISPLDGNTLHKRQYTWLNEGFTTHLEKRFSQGSNGYPHEHSMVQYILAIVPERILAAVFFEAIPGKTSQSKWHELNDFLAEQGQAGLMRRLDKINSTSKPPAMKALLVKHEIKRNNKKAED